MTGIATGSESLLTTVSGSRTTYDDTTATDPTKTYYYKVLAVNGAGTSCGNNEVAAPYLGNTCTGLIVDKTPPCHPEQPLQVLGPASRAFHYLAAGESAATPNVVFTMNVTTQTIR